jgi:crotonobetainyl-CoA:carnitine CoA-transferase CaiB-like acyl-CoA transferase
MVDIHQPGIGAYPVPRPVLDFSGWDDGPPAPAAEIVGEDTDDVLRALLGLDDATLLDLRRRSVIGGTPA